MSKFIYFKRYLYIIDRLRRRSCSFIELQENVIRKFIIKDVEIDFKYSIRTFERDKKDIFDLFGIVIQYDRREKYTLLMKMKLKINL